MTMWKLAGTTAVLALMAGQAAFADITPEDIWQKMKDNSAAYGQTVTTTSEAREGDTLTITGAVFATSQDGVETSITVPTLALTQADGGKVDITTPETMTINVKEDGSDVVLNLDALKNVITASGTVEATNYAVNAPETKITLATIDGKPAAEAGGDVTITIADLMGEYVSEGETVTSNLTSGGIDIVAHVDDKETGDKANISAKVADLVMTGTNVMPDGVDMADMAAALAAGFSTEANITYGKTDFAVDFTNPNDSGNVKGSIGSGSFNLAMDAANLTYGTTYNTVDVSVSGQSIPLPEVKVGLGEGTFNFMLPLAKSDKPADFSLLTKFIDLSISDDIWGMADPTGNFPHDPLTFVLDTKGTITLLADLFDEAAMAEAGDVPPAELNSLDLTALQLKALGAEVTGVGALTFDNSDMTSFDGMPAPTGKITLNASGINALLDKIAAMGMIPEDQLMGARMMMGMFAKPGEGEDTLTSELEFKDGGFFANGMQLK